MKYVYWLTFTLLLSSCASSRPTAISQTETPSPSVSKGPEELHHLACIQSDSGQAKMIIQEIEAKRKTSGAILYFHGGLSSKSYMKEELGPMLLDSLFKQDELSTYYPVFVNYEASIFQTGNLLKLIERIYSSQVFKQGISKLQIKLDKAPISTVKSTALDDLDSDVSRQAAFYLNMALMSLPGQKSLAQLSAEELQVQSLSILENDDMAEAAGVGLMAMDSEFSEIARDFEESIEPERKELGVKAFTPIEKIGIGIARSLARFAIGNYHQVVPTLEEEIFRSFEYYGVSIKNIAADHWELVKIHARQCFEPGSAGLALVNELLEYRNKNPEFSIHTISHSAGSIPPGRLL